MFARRLSSLIASIAISMLGALALSAQSQVDVTPNSGSLQAPPNATERTATFWVKNLSSSGKTFYLTCFWDPQVTSCASPGTVFVPGMLNIPVSVTYATGALGNGILRLRACDNPQCSGSNFDTGTYNVTVQVFSLLVTPDGAAGAVAPTRRANIGGYSAEFTVWNAGTSTDSYSLTCTGSANVGCGTITPSSISNLAAGATATVTVNYSVGAAGSGSLTLTATGSFSTTDAGSYAIPVAFAGGPLVDFTPYNFASQDYSRCAANCFATIYAQGTVPYFSLDAPRNVTLVYNGDRLSPRPFVHINVMPDTGYAPSEYRLEVKVNGARVTFVNGDTILRFTYPGRVPTRLGAQFDASGYATNVYPIEILVSAYYAGSQSLITTALTTKLAVVNETSSPVAAGWTLSGVQRLYPQADGSALITEGEGSAVYFANTGSLFVTPSGEFSALVSGIPGGGAGWTRLYADSTKVVFNSAGRMTQVRNRFNTVTNVEYDGSSRVWRISDPQSLYITLSYDANGLSSVADPWNRTTVVTVNASRKLTGIRDLDNVSTTFGYDGSQRLQTVTNRRGHATAFGYHPGSWKLETVTSPPVEIFGEGTGSLFDQYRSWQHRGVPYGSTGGTPLTSVLVDSAVALLIDPGADTTRFTTDRWGQPMRSTDAIGRVTRVDYNQAGLIVRVTRPSGALDTLAYEARGLLTYSRPAGLGATSTRYAAWALADSTWGDERPGQRLFVGAPGRVDSARVAGSMARYTYDVHGRITKITDPLGHLLTKVTYAGTNNNRARDSLPGGRLTTYGYDQYGRRTSVSRTGAPTQTTDFDVLNRPTALWDGVNANPVRYTYDSISVRTVTDQKGQVYEYVYDALGQLQRQIDPLTAFDRFEYDRHGNVRRWWNRRGQSIDRQYDRLHRQVKKTGQNIAADSVTYGMDDRWVTTLSLDPNHPWSETTYLSPEGRADSVKTTLNSQTYTRKYSYTAVGRLDSMWTTASSGAVFQTRRYRFTGPKWTLDSLRFGNAWTTFQYDGDRLIDNVSLPVGGATITPDFTDLHGPWGLLLADTVHFPAPAYDLFGYDSLARVRQHHRNFGSYEDGFHYGFDGLGRLVTDSSVAGGSPSCSLNAAANFGYICSGTGWFSSSVKTFSYDQVGNRTDLGATYNPVGSNRLATFDGCTYTADADGNTTSRTCSGVLRTFYWSAENRLDSIYSNGSPFMRFAYSPDGNLARSSSSFGAPSYYLWNGANLLAELDPQGQVLVEYLHRGGFDNLHAKKENGITSYYMLDHTGTPIAAIDDNVTSQRFTWDVWGRAPNEGLCFQTHRATPAWKGALWVGCLGDELYYMRNRWYNPRTGRFMSEDPMGLAGGINPYAFAGNDPVNGRDPLGLDHISVSIIGGPGGGICDPDRTTDPACEIMRGECMVTGGSWSPTFGTCTVYDDALTPGSTVTDAGDRWFGDGETVSLGPEGPSCGAALLGAGLSLVGDVLIWGKGLNLLVKSSRAAASAMRAGARSDELLRAGRYVEAGYHDTWRAMHSARAVDLAERGGMAAARGELGVIYSAATAPVGREPWWMTAGRFLPGTGTIIAGWEAGKACGWW